MQAAARRRTRSAIAASAAAHAALLAIVLIYRPLLTSPVEFPSGPMETVIPVLMTPRSHLAHPRETRAASIPLTRPGAAARNALPASPSRPSAETTEPTPSAPAPPGAEGEAAPAPAPDIRQALRHGATGCLGVLQAGMTREERERCDERLALGVKTAPYIQTPLEPRMRGYYDAVIKAKAPDKPWTPNRAIGALGRFDPEPRASGDHLPAVGCVVPFGLPKKITAKEKQALKKHILPHALWLGPCFIEPPKGSLDPEVDVPVP